MITGSAVRLRTAIAGLVLAGGLCLAVVTPAVTVQSAVCLVCWLATEAQAPTDPDIEARPDDVWTSECDGDICQSVPGFIDPGPGAPGGPFGPRW